MAVVAITMLCLLLSNLQMQSQPLPNRRDLHDLVDLGRPRKLRISKEVPSKLEKAEEDEFAGKEEQLREINGNGEWDEDEDEDDPLEYFSMDYTSVKRRRPIHNRSTQHP